MAWCVKVSFKSGRYPVNVIRYTEDEARNIYDRILKTGRFNGFNVSKVEIFQFKGSNKV